MARESIVAQAEAVTAWLEIKRKLRKRIPRAEWFLWVQPSRLLFVSPAKPAMLGCELPCMIIGLPRSGRAIYKSRGRENLMSQICRKAGFYHFFTVIPDDYEQQRIVERLGRPVTFLDPDPMEISA